MNRNIICAIGMNRMEMWFGRFLVKKEKKNFVAIYDNTDYEKKFITHRNNWRQATNLAELLSKYYIKGQEDARDDFCC
ncbi:hypothetical protein AAGG74_15075 [Bacillus mexicanus]|uniref:hypothetical protein n=1 Tax=Bacillus mexicanus TaxID=2834415 RepID=UPI003D1AC878